MNMKTSKILAEFFLLLRPNILEVLVAEHHNTALSYQQCELILLSVRQLG